MQRHKKAKFTIDLYDSNSDIVLQYNFNFMKAIDRLRKLKNHILNPIHELRAKDSTDDLDKLGKIYGTDKAGSHSIYNPLSITF